MVDWGADAVKILIYYTPFEDAAVNDIKHAFIERIGAECETYEIPFFLEFVGYDPQGRRREGLRVRQGQAGDRQPEHGGVFQAAVQGGRAQSGSAGQCRVRGRDRASTRARRPTPARKRCAHFREAAAVAAKPFIYLSAGVGNAQFTESLQHGGRGRHGLLRRAVRARHLEGGHPGLRQAGRSRRWRSGCRREGVKNIDAVNEAIRSAKPWYEKMGVSLPA